MNAVFYILLLVVPILVSGFLMFFIRPKESVLKLLLAFSAAYLLALSFLHLLPELFSPPDSASMGIWIMAGFFIQVMMEFLSSGIEHGHVHVHAQVKKVPVVMLFGLYLHSFIEGFPLNGIFSHCETKGLFSFLTGITLHNIPISIAFAGMLLHQEISRGKIALSLFTFSAMAPLGATTGYYIQKVGIVTQNLPGIFMAIVVGIFLHVGTTIIFEGSEKNHRYHISKLVSIILGAGLAWILARTI